MNTSTLEVEVKKAKENETILGSEAVLRCLVEEGVDTIFGYPGGAIMPVYVALYGYADQLNHILSRHEQGAIQCCTRLMPDHRIRLVCVLPRQDQKLLTSSLVSLMR